MSSQSRAIVLQSKKDIEPNKYSYKYNLTSNKTTLKTQRTYYFGFNGKENDNEVKGDGNQQDYGLRIYDNRLGRFLSVDPLGKKFPFYTPYQFAGNTPIQAVDVDGGEPIRPKSLIYDVNELGFIDKKLSDKKWSYSFYIPAEESSNGNATVMMVSTSVGVQWYVERIWGTGTQNYIHMDDRNWVCYKGVWYDCTDISDRNIKPEDFNGRMTWDDYWSQQQNLQDGLNKMSNSATAGLAVGGLLRNVQQIASALRSANSLCFEGSTKVYCKDSFKQIKYINIGDSVWSFNVKSNRNELKIVTDISNSISNDIIFIKVLSDTIKSTSEHLFFVNHTWIKASMIKKGDSLFTAENKYYIVEENPIKDTNRIKVYNITVAENHNYYVSHTGILVHNVCFDLNSVMKSFNASKKNWHDVKKGIISDFKEIYKENKSLLKKIGDNPDVGIEDGKIFLKSTNGSKFQTKTDMNVTDYKLE